MKRGGAENSEFAEYSNPLVDYSTVFPFNFLASRWFSVEFFFDHIFISHMNKQEVETRIFRIEFIIISEKKQARNLPSENHSFINSLAHENGKSVAARNSDLETTIEIPGSLIRERAILALTQSCPITPAFKPIEAYGYCMSQTDSGHVIHSKYINQKIV